MAGRAPEDRDDDLPTLSEQTQVAPEQPEQPQQPEHPDEADYPDFLPVPPQHYVYEREIAQGGMGRVLSARDRRLHRRVAIKEVLPGKGDLPRFKREALITAKLQHPGIVDIHEAGFWPNGAPFFAMKMIAGRSLYEVLAGTKSFADRLALLPSVIAAVEALAYAHSRGVIHRDLKPGNILVGDFGETVVIDWGIAKDLGTTDPAAETQELPVDEPEELTRAGAVMGTLTYMSPEQALGLTVDERTDVFALGAILYHLLGGTPPYGGRSTAETLKLVRAARPTPLDQVEPRVPRDLVTIVAKAMAAAVDERYRTALELARDLKQFQTGQLVGSHRYSRRELVRRWLVRNRLPAGIGAAALALIVTLTAVFVHRVVGEKRAAERARALAEQRESDARTARKGAEQLIEFMVFTLKDRLQAVGKLDVLEGMGDHIVGYYHSVDSLDAATGSGAAEGEHRAAALDLLGDVERQKGNVAAALRAYRAAQDLRTRLLERDPTSLLLQKNLSMSHEKIGPVLFDIGDLDGALASYRASLAVRERAAAADPTNAQTARDVGASQVMIGDVELHKGDDDAALRSYRASAAIFARLTAAEPANAKWRRNRAITLVKIGDVTLRMARLDEARMSFQAAHDIITALLEHDRANASLKRDLAITLEDLGDVEYGADRFGPALEAYRGGADVLQDMTKSDPGNADWQRLLAIAEGKVGTAQLALGDNRAGLASQQAALEIAERLVAKDGANGVWLADLARQLQVTGDAALANGDLESGLRLYRRAVELADRLVKQDPENADWQVILADGCLKVAQTIGHGEGARPLAERSLAILEELQRKGHMPQRGAGQIAVLRKLLAGLR